MNHPPVHPSPRASERHLTEIGEALEAVRQGWWPGMHAIAWPAGLDRGNISSLPISVRARNCLLAERLNEGADALTVLELRGVQNFGFKCLQDLVLNLERFLTECIRVGATQTQSAHEPSPGDPGAARADTESTPGASPPSDHRIDAGVYLNPLLAAGAELYGAQSLADALSPEFLRLASKMGLEAKLAALDIQASSQEPPDWCRSQRPSSG